MSCTCEISLKYCSTEKHAENSNIGVNTHRLSAVIHASSVCSRGLDHRLAFPTQINSRTSYLGYCQSVQKLTLRRPVSMETQAGHETALRWILCVALPAELVHLGFIFFLVYIFLFLFFFHFLSYCSAAGPEPDFSASFFHSLTFCFSPTDT